MARAKRTGEGRKSSKHQKGDIDEFEPVHAGEGDEFEPVEGEERGVAGGAPATGAQPATTGRLATATVTVRVVTFEPEALVTVKVTVLDPAVV